ncbi:MAG TPA: hypothetical protein VGB14_18830 [Acidimicrobiales bacterium]|jgi:hypothetical protein
MPDVTAWDPTDWAAAGTVAYAAIALVAAIFVYFQVREARRAREEQARPFVVVDIQPSTVWWNVLNLVVENVGTTVAHDVRIHFTPAPASSRAGYDLAHSSLLSDGIPTLPPRRRIEALFDVASERKDSGLPNRYDVEVRFRDYRRREQEPLRFVIDFSYLYGLQRIEKYGVHHAAKALREIERVLKSSRRGGRLAIWVRSEDADIEADRIEEAMTGHYPSLGRKSPPELVLWLGRSVLVRSLVRWCRSVRTRIRPGA